MGGLALKDILEEVFEFNGRKQAIGTAETNKIITQRWIFDEAVI